MHRLTLWLQQHHRSFRSLGFASLLLTLSVWAYGPSLHGPFFFDDEHFIQKNIYVHSLKELPKLFSSSVTAGAGFESNFYRPLQQLSFALVYKWFQADVSWPYHALSMAFHGLNGVLLFFLCLRLGLAARGALVAMGLFLLHPVQTEAVCYISGFSDPLAMFFMLLGLYLYAGSLFPSLWQPWRSLAAPLVCMIMALFAKESAVVFAPLALIVSLYAWTVQGRGYEKRFALSLGSFALCSALYLLFKFTLMSPQGGLGLTTANDAYTQSLALRLITFVNVLWDYVVLLIYPAQLFYEKPYTAYATLLSPRGALGLFLIAAALLSLLTFRKRPRVALGVSLVLSSLVPFSGIIPLNAMFLEHWLYVPMLGLSYLVGLAFEEVKPFEGRILAVSAALLLFVLAAQRTAARAEEWADVEKFYLNEIAQSGGSVRMHNNLGMYYADRQDLGRAVKFYESAIQVDATRIFPQPLYNLARAHVAQNDLPRAFLLLQESLTRNQRFSPSLNLMREIFAKIGDSERETKTREALESLLQAGDYDYPSFKREVFDSLLENP